MNANVRTSLKFRFGSHEIVCVHPEKGRSAPGLGSTRISVSGTPYPDTQRILFLFCFCVFSAFCVLRIFDPHYVTHKIHSRYIPDTYGIHLEIHVHMEHIKIRISSPTCGRAWIPPNPTQTPEITCPACIPHVSRMYSACIPHVS